MIGMNSHRISTFTISSERYPAGQVLSNYSRMKYGDPKATKILAEMLSEKFSSDCPSAGDFFGGDGAVLTSSAFGTVPTAAHALTNEFGLLLESKGANLDYIKIERSQNLEKEDYATLNHSERRDVMATRRLSLSKRCAEKLRGRPLIVVDDLFATGRHEQAIVDLLNSVIPIRRVLFLYIFEFSRKLSYSNPMAEHVLNGSHIKKLNDYLSLFQERGVMPYINARVVKFLLSEGSANKKSFKDFLREMPTKYCEKLLDATGSDDMKKITRAFFPAVEMPRNEMLDRLVLENSSKPKVML